MFNEPEFRYCRCKMLKLSFFKEDGLQKKKKKFMTKSNFVCDSAMAGEDMVGAQGLHRLLLICTDVPPHFHKRDTTVAGSPSCSARLRIFCISTLHTTPFDSDGSWKPGDRCSCNNINALCQVFKSETCLIIITTYVLFILLQRDKLSQCFVDGFVLFFLVFPSHLSVLFSSPGSKREDNSLGRWTKMGENGGGSSDLQIIYLRLASA